MGGVVDVIISQVKWKYTPVYLDGCIVFRTSVEQYFDHLSTFLSLIKDASVSLKLIKCSFFTDDDDYLGHIIRPGKLQVANKLPSLLKVSRNPQP